MTARIIRGCNIDPETGGWSIEYLTPGEDVRTNGLVHNHALLIPPEDDLIHLVDLIGTTLQTALDEALQMSQEAHGVGLDLEDADDTSPYDNPSER